MQELLLLSRFSRVRLCVTPQMAAHQAPPSLQCRRPGFNPGLGRSPGEGNGNPLQCSCLENPRDRESLVGCHLWGHTESDTTEAT